MDNTIGFPNTYPIYPVERCHLFEQLAQRFYFWREIGGCGSVRPTKPTHEESLAPGVYVSGNVSKSFIYCNIVKPVYNSHPLLRKATENFWKLSGDRNIQGDRFRAVTYRFMQRWTFICKIKIDFFLPEMLCTVFLVAENGTLQWFGGYFTFKGACLAY